MFMYFKEHYVGKGLSVCPCGNQALPLSKTKDDFILVYT